MKQARAPADRAANLLVSAAGDQRGHSDRPTPSELAVPFPTSNEGQLLVGSGATNGTMVVKPTPDSRQGPLRIVPDTAPDLHFRLSG
jgi:hypothetical protein